jgi:hypothetical protein
LFARNSVTPEVQRFVEPRLGAWEDFVTKGLTDESKRRKMLGFFKERCGYMFARFLREQDMSLLIDSAKASGFEPTHSAANCLSAAIALGAACARMRSAAKTSDFFNLRVLGWRLVEGHRSLESVR